MDDVPMVVVRVERLRVMITADGKVDADEVALLRDFLEKLKRAAARKII
jgi:hypothetical protein